MVRLRILMSAACVLVIGTLLAQAQDVDVKAVVRKAIAAHGGEAKLIKLKAAKSKFKGTMDLQGKNITITGETTFQMPDKLKNDMTLDFNGMQIPIVQVYDGKTMWVSQLGKTIEVKDEPTLKEMRESLQTEGAGGLVTLLDGTYDLSAAGEVKVKGKDTIGVRVSKKGRRDYTLYFDKNTHLVTKIESRAYDPVGKQEITQEKFITEYQEKNGLTMARKVVIHKDGKLFMDMEILDTQTFEKLDDSVFAKP